MSSFTIEKTTLNFPTDYLQLDQWEVRSIPFNYDITFVNKEGLHDKLKALKKVNKQKHFVFIDKTVHSYYGNSIFKGLTYFKCKATESNKTLPVVNRLLSELQSRNFTKQEIFFSAGGGITQDVSSFARAVFKRGITWTYLPTTLLAMADSCIGAKACLNYGPTKNLLGLFSAPKAILIYPDFLKTLSDRDILSGYGEIIKLSIVGGDHTIQEFQRIQTNQKGYVRTNIKDMIKLSLAVKKVVIEADEYELSIRKALNYGHTVGHAIEPLVQYKIPHGIAVSIGMVAENFIAREFGSLSTRELEQLNKLIRPWIDNQSLRFLRKVPIKKLISNMQQDKKATTDGIYMAVPLKVGHFDLLKVSNNSNLENSLSEFFATFATR